MPAPALQEALPKGIFYVTKGNLFRMCKEELCGKMQALMTPVSESRSFSL
jgi:hypothetical protein